MNHQHRLKLILTSIVEMQLALRSICLRQVTYETVVSPLQVLIEWAVYITFYTIVANYNEPLAPPQAHIHFDIHMNVSKCS